MEAASHHIDIEGDGDDTTTQGSFRSLRSLLRDTLPCCTNLLVELLGTYLITFIEWAIITLQKEQNSVTYPHIFLGLTLITMVVISLKHITFHFNPAVTITLAIFGKFLWKEVPFYIVAQTLGCVLAIGTLIVANGNLFLSNVTPEVFGHQAFILEILITFTFVLLVFGFVFDGLKEWSNSGASTNLEKHTREAASKTVYEGLYMYIIAPTLGCLLGGMAYKIIRRLE